MTLTVFEICAGAGGQAIGLEGAGFELAGAVEIDHHACDTLRKNRPFWNVIENSVREVDGAGFRGIDLLAGGVPCPPFSVAGKQLGQKDERDLFPEPLRLTAEAKPRVVLLENVPGFASERFKEYRRNLVEKFARLGYKAQGKVLNACWFGVPQLRPRFVLVAFRGTIPSSFIWPEANGSTPATVGDTLFDLMSSRKWKGAEKWRKTASGIALIDGCFWHGCPKCYRLPEDNRTYWRAKVLGNRKRDRRRTRELRALKWKVIRIWEHSLKSASGRASVLKKLKDICPNPRS